LAAILVKRQLRTSARAGRAGKGFRQAIKQWRVFGARRFIDAAAVQYYTNGDHDANICLSFPPWLGVGTGAVDTLKLSNRFITFPVEDGLIVARRDGDRLFVMNGSARFMWEKRAEGIPDANIPQLTAMHYGIDIEQAREDFGKTLREWQAEGLAEPLGRRRYYWIDGAPFSVHYPNIALESAIAPMFAHLERSSSNGQSTAEFDLADEDKQSVLRSDGLEILRSDDLDAIIDKLTFSIVMHACDSIKSLISIHAAGIGTPDHCVLIAAPSGSGKSTLAAALLASGHLFYLTDDLSLIEPRSFHAVPVPGTLVLKSGSWPALQPLLPTLGDLPVRRRGGQDVRYWSPPAAQVATVPLPVRAIVFAGYQDAAKTHLEPLTLLQGLSRLIAAPCAVRAPITTELVCDLVRWAGEIPFYALAYGSLGEARQIVEDLLGK